MGRVGLLALMLAASLGAALADETATKGDPAKGVQLFDSHGCGFCHENGGKSAGKGPQLMGTTRSDSFITFRITHGKEAAMPAFASSFSTAQIADLIAYIRSLKE